MVKYLILKWNLVSQVLRMKEGVQGIDEVKRGIKSILLDTSLKSEYESTLVKQNEGLTQRNVELQNQMEALVLQKADLE